MNKSIDVLLDVVTNIKDDNIIHSKKSITDKCCAAVKHKIKGKSLIDLDNGLDVYLIKKNTTEPNKIFSSYVQCCMPREEGNTLCHIHKKTYPNNLIKMEDLIKTSFKAYRQHEYYAKILEKEKLEFKNITKSKKQSSKQNIIEKSSKELLEFLEKKNSNESEEYDNENNLLESSHQETIDENEDNDEEHEEEEEGIECVEITSINGTTFYLDESSTEVYKIIEDNNILVGKLKEINEKYYQINHKDKKYSIFCEETKTGKTYLKCYLTGKKFDLSLKPLK